MTRVIAGPVCTKFLAAYGAQVLRLDPPGFAEVPALLPETTAGKRTAALDLRVEADRGIFENLVADADVLVTGLRADALAGLGYGDGTLTAINPALIVASLNAYGWDGPWRHRRGFDSLVQMSCGIAAAGSLAAGRDEPLPLPVQALDHATRLPARRCGGPRADPAAHPVHGEPHPGIADRHGQPAVVPPRPADLPPTP